MIRDVLHREHAAVGVADHDRRRKAARLQPVGGVAIVRDRLFRHLKGAARDGAAVQRRHHVVAAPVEGERREAEPRQMRRQEARRAGVEVHAVAVQQHRGAARGRVGLVPEAVERVGVGRDGDEASSFIFAGTTGNSRYPCLSPAKMQRGLPTEDLPRPVDRIVVQERPAALQLVLEVRQPPARAAAVFVVLAAHGQRDAIAGRHHDRGRPQLDVELDRRAGRQRLLLVVGVIGPVGRRELRVELAVRGAQPALRDRRVRIDRALEHDLLQVRRRTRAAPGTGRRRWSMTTRTVSPRPGR